MLTDEHVATLRKASAVLCGAAYYDEARVINAILVAHSAGAQEPVAWAVYNGWSKIAFYISEEGARDHAKAAQRSHDLSGSLAAFRVVPLYAHPQPMPQTDAGREIAQWQMKRRDDDTGEWDEWVNCRPETVNRYSGRAGFEFRALAEIERIDRAEGE